MYDTYRITKAEAKELAEVLGGDFYQWGNSSARITFKAGEVSASLEIRLLQHIPGAVYPFYYTARPNDATHARFEIPADLHLTGKGARKNWVAIAEDVIAKVEALRPVITPDSTTVTLSAE